MLEFNGTRAKQINA